MSENFIVTLPADGLSSVEVKTVRLSRNAVRHISTAAFRGLVAVTQLDLSHNQIAHLPSGVFSPLAHLHTLKLRYNRLANIGPRVFAALPHLYDLDLQVSSSEEKKNCFISPHMRPYFSVNENEY